ncbi:MAG TPA: hypothetical protein VLS93_02495 [Anaeromyxobacteraceae bacterium]|nr:hypothetical protein [Anaeromyxobacteraceae bacterium]
MRPSSAYLVFLALLLLLAEAAAVHARRARIRSGPVLEEQAAVVGRLGLTDLCLFTEARYTRHPSQSDRFSPFQDHPHALEHFPSGSLAAPPR